MIIGVIIIRKYIEENYDFFYFDNLLQDVIKSDLSVRDKVVKVALFFYDVFPKLPYFWGGGHDAESLAYFKHLDWQWGALVPIIFSGSDEYPVGKFFKKSLDCSGFVTFCLVAGGFDLISYLNSSYCLDSIDCLKLGEVVRIEESFRRAKAGDLAWIRGHVGVVIEVDELRKCFKVIHISSSGKGLNMTTLMSNGVIVEDDLGELPEGYVVNRVGDKYFTHFILVNY